MTARSRQRTLPRFLRWISRQHHDRQKRARCLIAANLPEHLVSVHPRHEQIEQDEIGPKLLDHAGDLPRISDRPELGVPCRLEYPREQCDVYRLIIDQQQTHPAKVRFAFRRLSHLAHHDVLLPEQASAPTGKRWGRKDGKEDREAEKHAILEARLVPSHRPIAMGLAPLGSCSIPAGLGVTFETISLF